MRMGWAVALAATTAAAGAEAPIRVGVLDYGVECGGEWVGVPTEDDTVDGEMAQSTSFDGYDVRTQVVPARVGVAFGAVLRLDGGFDPVRGFETLRAHAYHPPMGASGRTSQEWRPAPNPYGQVMLGYVVEDEFEVVEGEWRFALTDAGETIAEVAFTMVPEEMAEAAAAVCAGPPLGS